MECDHTFPAAHALPGADIQDAILETISNAKELHTDIILIFNGVNLFISENSIVEDVVKKYHTELRQ